MGKYFVLFYAFVFILPLTLAAQPQAEDKKDTINQSKISHSQRELGIIVLEDLQITDGKIMFRAATGGCTEKSSFQVHFRKEPGLGNNPHYVLAIERIVIDDCKAFLPDGVVIEYDLKKDLGLNGDYTIAITNPTSPKTK